MKPGRERLPFYFYHSPIFAPSFDEDGRAFYLGWLGNRYSIGQINERYGTAFSKFEDMGAVDYWVHPDHADEAQRYLPTTGDYDKRSAVVLKYADNQRFKQEVMCRYFAEITQRLREKEPRFYSMRRSHSGSISSGTFLIFKIVAGICGNWAPRSTRLLSSRCRSTITATSSLTSCRVRWPCCEARHKRRTSSVRFSSGAIWPTTFYAVCSSAEVVASAFGAGATELYFYGYNGLDDGGNFGKWGAPEKASLKRALDWFADVRKVAGRRIKTRTVAILFPYASYTLSAFSTDARRYVAFREDLLGWFRQFADHGLSPDVLHPSQVKASDLRGYKYLVVPADPHYWAMPDIELETEVRAFVENGGVLLHSVSEFVEKALGFSSQLHAADSFEWEEKIVTGSEEFGLL